MKKRLLALALTLLILCAAPLSALAAVTSGTITASYGGGTVTFSGEVTTDVRAVAVVLFNPSGDQVAMTTCGVTLEGLFSGEVDVSLSGYGVYSVKAADYDGGPFFAETTFNYAAPSVPLPVPAPVAGIESGESISVTNIERLVTAGTTLTVEGENGAKLVFDADSLKGISEQAEGSVEVTIADVSEDYEQTHPDKLVFSLTVGSGDKVITDFGGSVTVSLPYELNEGELADNVTVWHLTESGVLVAIPCTYDPSTKLVSFTVSHFSLYMVGVASPWENPFADVIESDWFYDAVRFVHENGLMVGTDKSTFGSQDIASRGMIVTILWRLEGEPASEYPMTFTDVAEDKWYYKAIAWAVEKGIVDGYNTLHFGPDDDITREQMGKILYRFATYKRYDVNSRDDLSAFTDSPSDWAMESVQWAVAEKIIQGKGFNLLDLQAGVKRCECAEILQRFISN